MTFPERFYKPALIIVLLAFSIIAMLEFKSKFENARVINSGDEAIFRSYFWLSVGVFSCTLGYASISWFFEKWKIYQQLKNERVAAELALLKNKIDPHFFFNTLNNLYGLAKEKSDHTPDVVLKLSDIMRYVIYDGGKERVPISDEIEYLDKYIELHKIRHRSKVKLDLQKDVDQWYVEIAPLLLVILFENAVKHGIEKVSDKAYLSGRLELKRGQLRLEVENKHDYSEMSDKGVGLTNLKRRLELIYPMKHTLDVQMNGDRFVTKLEIDLT